MKRNLFIVMASALLLVPAGASGQMAGISPPSILSQCSDQGQVGIGPDNSARARECTRQYCARPEYRAKITAYAMHQRQSESDRTEALICITRWEQDRAKY